VETPAGIIMYFMPPRPYLPIGRLRDAFCYPSAPDTFDAAAIEHVLERVGLGHLAHKLEETANWEQTLSLSERQRMGVASMLLHRPKWLLLQESLDSIDADGQRAILKLLDEDLPNTAIITVSHQRAVQVFHTRTIALELTESGRRPAKEMKTPAVAERRGHTDISWHQHLLGILRRDRRQHPDG
jgi:putative ATP-binding cassette transporter